MADNWYIAQNGQQVGPMSIDELRQRLAAGQFRPDELVWCEGMPTWVPAGSVPGLGGAAPSPGMPGLSAPVLGYGGPQMGSIQATYRTLDFLRQTKPWARFMGVMMFVLAGLMVVGALGMMIAGASRYSGGSAGMMGMAFGYMLSSLLIIAPGIFLNRYASRISSLLATYSPQDLEGAMEAQKSYWKYIGVLTLVMLCFYAVVLVILAIGLAVGGRFLP